MTRIGFLSCALAALSVSAVLYARDCAPVLPMDGRLVTDTIQKAIDDVSSSGGGVVLLPHGVWVTGGLALRDNVTLRLPEGCTLLGSTNRADYAHGGALVFTRNAVNTALDGAGTIDGRGALFPKRADGRRWLPHLINFYDCKNVRVEGLHLREAGTWLLHPRRCDGVMIRNVTIFNHANQCNDGIDVSSRNVLIENCVIDADDDAIVMKTMEPDIVVENVVIRNCRLASSCNFVKFGTETHGVTRNVNVENCTFFAPTAQAVFNWPANTPGCTNRLTGLAGLAFECVDGGLLENITVRNVKGGGMHTPIFVRLGRRNKPSRQGPSGLRRILVENYEAVAESRIACSITGVEGLRPQDITLRNIRLTLPGGGSAWDFGQTVPEKEKTYPECRMFDAQALPAYGFYIRHADRIHLENVTLVYAQAPETRPALVTDDTTDVTTDAACSFQVPSDGGPSRVVMTDAVRASIAAAFKKSMTRPDGWFACPPGSGGKKPPLLVLLGQKKGGAAPEEKLSALTARGLAVLAPFADDVSGVLDTLARVRNKIDPERVYLKGDDAAAALALRVLAASPEHFTAVNAVSLLSESDPSLARVKGARVELVCGVRDPALGFVLRAWNALAEPAARLPPRMCTALLETKVLPPGEPSAPYVQGYNDVGRPVLLTRTDNGNRLIVTDTGRVGVFLPTIARMQSFTNKTAKIVEGPPADAAVELTADGRVIQARGARVTRVSSERMPDGQRCLRFSLDAVKTDGTLDLKVTGLPPRNWVVQENGWTRGKWLDEELARGIRIRPSAAGDYSVSKRFGVSRPADWDTLWARLLIHVKSSLDGTQQPCYFWAPPAAAEKPVPLIVGLHTWSASYRQTEHYRTVLEYARAKGWAMIGPNFRGPNETPPACGGEPAVQDIVDAINEAKKRVAIDPKRIYIIGGSGGGHMTLLMAGRHPELFAAAAAFCPITDLARWHADSLLKHPGRGAHYAGMLEAACGGTPSEKAEQYRNRSPLTWLDRAARVGLPVYIVTGIHDGWTGSVPVGHSFRAFNALAAVKDRVSEAEIAAVEAEQRVPATLVSDAEKDPFYDGLHAIRFRRTSQNVRFTLYEGGHGGNFPAGLDFLSRQVKGRPADFTIPAVARGGEEKLGK